MSSRGLNDQGRRSERPHFPPKWLLGGFFCCLALSQTAVLPAKWQATSVLDLQESKIGQIWAPGLPEGIKLLGQTLKITVSGAKMKLAGDTVLSQIGSIHEDSELDPSSPEITMPVGAKQSFKQVDESSFEVVLSLNNKNLGNHVGENRFVFSSDGNKLTETKTHIEREIAGEGGDPATSPVLRTSTSVLVFHRTAE